MSEPTPAESAAEPDQKFGGAFGRIKAQRAAIVAKEGLKLRVPGYEDLQVRYKLMPEKTMEEVGRKMESAKRQGVSGKRMMEIAADFLVSACDCIEVRDDSGAFVDLLDDHSAEVRFDNRLADCLGIPVEEARAVVLETFSPEADDGLRRHPDSIIDHLEAIGSWRKGREYEIDQDLLGE